MSLSEITAYEMRTLGVESLPTRPTSPREFGGRGYTPQELKQAFDRLPRLIAKRYNELVEHITDGEYLADIPYEDTTLRAYLEEQAEILAAATEEAEQIRADFALQVNMLKSELSAEDEKNSSSITALEDELRLTKQDVALNRYLVMNTVVAEVETEDTYRCRTAGGGVAFTEALPARLTNVAGATELSENILDVSDAQSTSDSIVVTADNNTLTFEGVPKSSYSVFWKNKLPIFKNGQPYTFSQSQYFGSSGVAHTVRNAVYWQINRTSKKDGTFTIFSTATAAATIVFDFENYDYLVTIRNGSFAYSEAERMYITVSFMCAEGLFEKPYAPYFNGFRHAAFSGNYATGKNLLCFTDAIDESGRTSHKDGVITCRKTEADEELCNVIIPLKHPLKKGTAIFMYEGRNMQDVPTPYLFLEGDEGNFPINMSYAGEIILPINCTRLRVCTTGNTPACELRPMVLLEKEDSVVFEEGKSSVGVSLPSPVVLPQWDSLDYETGTHVLGTAILTFDGSEEWLPVPSDPVNDGNVIFACKIAVEKEKTPDPNATPLCNFFTMIGKVNCETPLMACIHSTVLLTEGDGDLTVKVHTCGYENVEAWKSRLAEMFAAGIPLTYVYKTKHETKMPMTAAEPYRVRLNGWEFVEQGEAENTGNYLGCTVRQKYYVLCGKEAVI